MLLKNQERVWKAEQEDAVERRKMAELQKQIQEERMLQDMQRMQDAATGKQRRDRVEWMYSVPATAAGAQNEGGDEMEEYLLGKRRVDDLFKNEQPQRMDTLGVTVGSSSNVPAGRDAPPLGVSSRDTANKIRGDPLLAIKRQEQAQLEAAAKSQMYTRHAHGGSTESRTDRSRRHRHRHRDDGSRPDRRGHREDRYRDDEYYDRRRGSREYLPHERSSHDDEARPRRHDRHEMSPSRHSRMPQYEDSERFRRPYGDEDRPSRRHGGDDVPRRRYTSSRASSPARSAVSPHREDPSSTGDLDRERAARLAAMQADAVSLSDARRSRVDRIDSETRADEEREAAARAENSRKWGSGERGGYMREVRNRVYSSRDIRA